MSTVPNRKRSWRGLSGRLVLFPFLFGLAYLAVQSEANLIPLGGIARSVLVMLLVLVALTVVLSRFTTMARTGVVILAGLVLMMPALGDLAYLTAFTIGMLVGLLVMGLASHLLARRLDPILARRGPFYSFVSLFLDHGWLYVGLAFLTFEVIATVPGPTHLIQTGPLDLGLLIGGVGAIRWRGLSTIDQRTVLMLNRAGVLTLFVVILSGLSMGRLMIDLPQTASNCPSGIHAGPNMYVFLLDAHASEATMSRLYDYNMEPFLSRLETDGFYVDRNSHSNYDHTQQTLSSMLNFTPMQDQPAIAADFAAGNAFNLQSVDNAIHYSQAFNLLHCAGYQIVATAMPDSATAMASADQYISGGQVNDIELTLLSNFHVLPLIEAVAPTWLDDQQRSGITSGMANAVHLASIPTSKPRFVWAHLLSPHDPTVFVADGPSPITHSFQSDYFQGGQHKDPAVYIPQQRAQLEYIDNQIATSVEQIAAADPTAVIMVFSDHGSAAYFNGNDPAKTDLAERFGNLFAIRTPGVSGIYSSPVTPLNILGPLFNQYLGTNIAREPDSSWFGPYYVDGKVAMPEVSPFASPTP